MGNDAKALNVRVANENYNIKDPYVVFEVEWLERLGQKGWSQRQASPIQFT